MTYRRDAVHTLVVTAENEDDDRSNWNIEIIHPDTCKTETWIDDLTGNSYTVYTCPTEHSWEMGEFDPSIYNHEITLGTHRVQVWWTGPDYHGECDGGWDFIEDTTND